MNNVKAISDDKQFWVLRLIEKYPNASQREIAASLGLSLGGVNYWLKTLIGRGLLRIENLRKSGNKLGYLYLPTPEGVAEKAEGGGSAMAALSGSSDFDVDPNSGTSDAYARSHPKCLEKLNPHSTLPFGSR